jgi:hypothetical protein
MVSNVAVAAALPATQERQSGFHHHLDCGCRNRFVLLKKAASTPYNYGRGIVA